MSVQDYIEVENSLFTDTGEGIDRDYYEQEVSEATIPDPEEASKKFIEKYGDEGVKDEYENIDDDEEKAYELFSPIKMESNNNFKGPLVVNNIIKENAETDSMFETRKVIYNRIIMLGIYSTEECDIYSRIITNKLWYNIIYSDKVEKNYKKIISLI